MDRRAHFSHRATALLPLAGSRQPHLKTERLPCRQVHLLAERCGHARQVQGQQFVKRRVVQHAGTPLLWVCGNTAGRVVILRAADSVMRHHGGGSGLTRQGLLVEIVCENRCDTCVRTRPATEGAAAGGFAAAIARAAGGRILRGPGYRYTPSRLWEKSVSEIACTKTAVRLVSMLPERLRRTVKRMVSTDARR